MVQYCPGRRFACQAMISGLVLGLFLSAGCCVITPSTYKTPVKRWHNYTTCHTSLEAPRNTLLLLLLRRRPDTALVVYWRPLRVGKSSR